MKEKTESEEIKKPHLHTKKEKVKLQIKEK